MADFTVLSLLGYMCTCGITTVDLSTEEELKESENHKENLQIKIAFMGGWQTHFRVDLLGGYLSKGGNFIFGNVGRVAAKETRDEAKGDSWANNKVKICERPDLLQSIVDVANLLLVKAQDSDDTIACAAIAALVRLSRIPSVRKKMPILRN